MTEVATEAHFTDLVPLALPAWRCSHNNEGICPMLGLGAVSGLGAAGLCPR